MIVRRSTVAAAALLSFTMTVGACNAFGAGSTASKSDSHGASPSSSSSASGSSADPSKSASPTSKPLKHKPSDVPADQTVMKLDTKFDGGITPKSVDANGFGLVIANNMLYSHTMTLYDTDSRTQVATISDTVDLAKFGFTQYPGLTKGAPVEAAWTKDGRYAYVSNYVMDGPNHHDTPQDTCGPSQHFKDSYVYRVDSVTKKIDQVIEVGPVPKYVAITPDQKSILVSNWCGYTISVIDRATGKVSKTIPIGTYPRGITVSPDSKTAYVAAFGTSNLYKVDLAAGTSKVFAVVGAAARHVTMSPDGKWLYTAASHADLVSKIDRETGKIVAQLHTLREPRSVTISSDGTAIYVVDYFANKMQKIRTSDLTVLQTVDTPAVPIGITYDPLTHSVWVACYGGQIRVYDDNSPAANPGATITPTEGATAPAAAPSAG